MTRENTPATSGGSEGSGPGHAKSRLGPLLCWAVVFADIGTSVYYVPGILYGQVGAAAGLFVTLTLIVFLLLALKYAEVSTRFPEGGGVVTVASRGISPWAGAVGGMFILVDYFLTAGIVEGQVPGRRHGVRRVVVGVVFGMVVVVAMTS